MFGPDKEEMAQNQKVKEEWVAALIELMKQLKQWAVEQIKLWEADPRQRVIPLVIESTVEKNEEHIGRYYAPMLAITAENYLVEIRPAGRFAIGPVGQVNMTNNKVTFSFLYSRRKGWINMESRKPLTRELFVELLDQMQ
ncbi:MAG TPA: hypothetical protein PK728_04060 [Bacillota bacterium]|nr:hypothetical protein [Bacillota bacterium]